MNDKDHLVGQLTRTDPAKEGKCEDGKELVEKYKELDTEL